jgi:hypothetical protein
METALMKLLGVIGTTSLFFLLGSTAVAYAPLDRQEPGDKPEKQEEKAKPEKQAQEKPVKQETKPAKQEQEKPAKQEAKQAKQEQDKPAKQEAKQAKQEQNKSAKQEAKPAKQEQEKPAKQEAKQAKQEKDKSTKQEVKQAKQEQNDNPIRQQGQQSAQSGRDGGNSGGGDHGRISDAHYRSSFGSEHHFHVNQGEFNHHRFSWGGYSFGFIDPWPVGWFYTDYVYVVYDDGGYYMCDVVHPGIRLSINIL